MRLLEAYSQLPAPSQGKCHIVIAGGKGWGKIEFQKKMENWRINDKIHFIDYLDELSLQYLYSKGRFSVMPSIYEGFGLPISEAMKYGTPAIAGNNSSMPEVAGPAGLLVDAKDINSIADALEILINDDVLRNDLSKKAIKHVKTIATRKSIDALLNVFKNSLKN